jgi:hypothetical protein
LSDGYRVYLQYDELKQDILYTTVTTFVFWSTYRMLRTKVT